MVLSGDVSTLGVPRTYSGTVAIILAFVDNGEMITAVTDIDGKSFPVVLDSNKLGKVLPFIGYWTIDKEEGSFIGGADEQVLGGNIIQTGRFERRSTEQGRGNLCHS